MNEDPVKLGRISTRLEKGAKQNFGDSIWVYVGSKELDELAEKCPAGYLARLSEAGKIIKDPDYLSYQEAGKTLYLIKEYLQGGQFRKVVLELHQEGQWYFKGLYSLSQDKADSLAIEGGIVRL